ncbi:MAG TPA: glycosyltransferase 87 family protein [Candidatus Limnocylindria bacterium]
MTGGRVAWIAYGALAAALTILGTAHWIWAVGLRGPVLYGEGAVANAAILSRERLEYASAASWDHASFPVFTAANYPPLYFHLAGIGDPFVTGRVLSILATLFVAGAIAWRARPAGAVVAAVLALAWLGSVPVLQWGAAVKPDLVALAFTVGAVMTLDRARPRHAFAGALLGVAAMAKPTALVPALALLVFVGRRDPRAAVRALASGVVAALAVAFVTHGPEGGALTHVIEWNALPWRAELAAPLVLLALVVLAVPIATIALTRPSTTIVTAYAAGALGVLLLGGREGATINYFLDLSAAIALALAGRAPLLAARARYPLAAIAQAAVAVLLLNPFGIIPGRSPSVGAWGDPVRVDVVTGLSGRVLVEDSGLLVATGRQPLVDDVFLWSRNRAREVAGQLTFPEGQALVDAVRAAQFDAIVSEVDLSTLEAVGGFERQRWHPDLVTAVLERYALRPPSALVDRPLFVYTRR